MHQDRNHGAQYDNCIIFVLHKSYKQSVADNNSDKFEVISLNVNDLSKNEDRLCHMVSGEDSPFFC